MKKFFKALALVLALTLVIGTIPAAAATEDYSMKYKTKKLYVGEKRGWKEENGETVYSKYLSKVSYAKAIVGIANKADAVDKDVTAKSSDKTVVSTHNKAKRVEAEGIGEATVTYYVGGKEVGSILYKVRKTATNDTVYFNRQITEDTKEVIVGTGYEVSLPRSIDKVQQDTDERRLYATDKDGNKVDEKKVIITPVADKERLWTVKFVEEGEYVLVGEAFQSEKSYPGTTGKATVTVTAAKAKPVDVKQTAANQFQIIFDEGVAAGTVIDENTLETGDIYYFIPGTEAAAPFSLIKKTEIKDNVVTVTMFQNFTSGTEYFVDAAGKVFSFVGTGTSLKDIESIKINKTSVPAGANTDLGYTIYNKIGLDITSAINSDAVNIEVVSGDDGQMVSTTEIYFEEVGKSVVVKATVFIGYDEENDYKEIIVSSEPTTVTSYNGAATTTAMKSSIAVAGASYIGKDSAVTNWFAIDDGIANGGVELQTIAVLSDGSVKKPSELEFTKVESADENIAIVTSGNVDTPLIQGIKAGTTQIVYYKTDANGNYNAAYAATVTVKAKRVASKIDAKFSQSLLNIDNATDEVKLSVSVLDQYDAPFTAATINIEQNDNNKKANGVVSFGSATYNSSSKQYEISLTGADFTALTSVDTDGKYLLNTKTTPEKVYLTSAKQYLYTVKVANTNLTKSVRFTAQAAGTVAAGYTLNVTELALDTSVLVDTTAKTSTITVSGSKNGYKTGDMNLWVVGTAPTTDNAVSGAGIYVVLKDKDNNAVTANTDFITLNDASIAITNLVVKADTTASGSAINLVNKLATGNYTVTAYSVSANATGASHPYSVKTLGTKTIKVTDAQKNPEFIKIADKAASAEVCFEYSFNGSKDPVKAAVDAGYPAELTKVDSANSTTYVKTAKVYIKLDESKLGGYLAREITVGKVITIE